MKKLLIVACGVALLGLTACQTTTTSGTDKDIQKQQAQLTQEANAQIGLPAITNFQEKKFAKMIYELRDQENVSTLKEVLRQSMAGVERSNLTLSSQQFLKSLNL